MIFFKFNVSAKAEKTFENERAANHCYEEINFKCDYFCKNHLNKDVYIFLVSIKKKIYEFDALFDGEIQDFDKIDIWFANLVDFLEIEHDSINKKEIFYKTFMHDNDTCCLCGFSREIIDSYKLRIEGDFQEKTIENNLTLKQVIEKYNALPVSKNLIDEFKRIYTKTESKFFAVPAHYFIKIEDKQIRDKVVQLIVESLHANKRLVRDKYTMCNFNSYSFRNFRYGDLSNIYNINVGGAVVINSNMALSGGNKYSREQEMADYLCEIAKTYADNTVTIVCAKSNEELSFYKNKLFNMLFIEAESQKLYNQDAKNFLKNIAQENLIDNPVNLTDLVEENQPYEVEQLRAIYGDWYKKWVKTILYPQYAQFVDKEIKPHVEEKEEHGIEELNSLIGLDSIKTVVQDYINYEIVKKECKNRFNKEYTVCRHMTFVGNPGTAKTTVARIVAKIMKEKGLLSRGNLIEVGRADIVSKYVGGTAPKVKELFEKALGNVLFIDEAYSLNDGEKNLYGDEAINAIVQEMENNRDDLVVIFAGYKKEMDSFLNRNPGLRSRIAYEIEFNDYSESDLLKIAELQAKSMGLDISHCKSKLKQIISMGKQQKNFGNGRFVRNVIEHARIKQATRIVNENKLNGDEINTLLPVDFELPQNNEKQTYLGFRED